MSLSDVDLVSTRISTGNSNENGQFTGIQQGEGCITTEGKKRNGFYVVSNGVIVHFIDSDSGDVSFANGNWTCDKLGHITRRSSERIIWRDVFTELYITYPTANGSGYNINLLVGTYLHAENAQHPSYSPSGTGFTGYVNLPSAASYDGLTLDLRLNANQQSLEFRCTDDSGISVSGIGKVRGVKMKATSISNDVVIGKITSNGSYWYVDEIGRAHV